MSVVEHGNGQGAMVGEADRADASDLTLSPLDTFEGWFNVIEP